MAAMAIADSRAAVMANAEMHPSAPSLAVESDDSI
jgi:hypothetical protein